MAERDASSGWEAVDDYIHDRLIGPDEALDQALAANQRAGLPAIDVSPPHGRMLNILARAIGARRILEVGTLGGYSTIWLARALPDDGRLISLEIDPHHAEIARANIEQAGLAGKVEVRVGPAADSLAAMVAAGEGKFDFAFIDADKQNNASYLQAARTLARSGALIVVDNVVREGRVVTGDEADAAIRGIRGMFDSVSTAAGLTATAVQTVGNKGWDGFLLAIVE